MVPKRPPPPATKKTQDDVVTGVRSAAERVGLCGGAVHRVVCRISCHRPSFEASLRRFGAAVYTQVRLIELQHLDDLATALLLPGILAAATVTLIHIRQGHSRRWLAGAALLLLVATLLISVTISVPINTVQQTWSIPNPPANWAAVRDRWQLAHAARTITAVVAFLALATRSAPRTAA